MKITDLPYSGAANEQLRTQLVQAISRAELASKNCPSVAAAELLNQLGVAYDYLFNSGAIPQPPSPVDVDSVVITPTATSANFTWDPAEVSEGGYPVNSYRVSVYLGSATSGASVVFSGPLPASQTEWDTTDEVFVPVDLEPETQYNLRIQASYIDAAGNEGGVFPATYKQFTTTAA